MARPLAVVLLLVATFSLARPKPSRDCTKQCDDVLKTMAAECRALEKGKGGGHDHEGGAEAKNLAIACKENLTKMRSACVKQCSEEPRRAK
jgi:hypothetical protein